MLAFSRLNLLETSLCANMLFFTLPLWSMQKSAVVTKHVNTDFRRCSPRITPPENVPCGRQSFLPHGGFASLVVWGWSGVAKVLFILRHRGVQLILAYSWARLAILVAGKGKGECFYFFCFFRFIPVSLSSLSLSFISFTISSSSFLPFTGRRHKMTHEGWCVVKRQRNRTLVVRSYLP